LRAIREPRDNAAMNADAARRIAQLALAPHPEGGFYRETYRSPLVLATPRGPRAAHTAIYFLLPAGVLSALHRVASDEAWHHYEGDPVDLHLIEGNGADARATVIALGHDHARGERPQHVVPAGVWQAAVPRGDRFALCGCTVAPGFDFADFELPPRAELLSRFPAHGSLVTSLTRADA
jgi:predicted cupin superfamily sugar epimerase